MVNAIFNTGASQHNDQPLAYVYNATPNFIAQPAITWETKAAHKWEQQFINHQQQVPAHAALLRPLIGFLVATLQPTRIYATNHDAPIADQHFTVTVVLPNNAPATETFRPIVDIVYLQHRHVYCTIYHESNLAADLKNNTLYALYHCNPANLVYDNSRICYPLISQEELVMAKQKAWEIFSTHFEKAQAFGQLAQSAPNHELTLFLLHQTMELTCRAVLLSLGGQNIKDHSLLTLFKHLRRQAPCLLEVFDEERDKPLLDTLEKSYIASRYEAGFKARPEIIPALISRVLLFQNTAAACVKKRTA